MSEIKVNKISPRTACGTTTLGDSGDTFTIPAGVTITNNGTQTGFGREGSVNWQTGSIKTATFTATSGEGYFCNTTAGVFTVNLPSSPSAGNIVAIKDYAQTFATNNLTVGRGGSNIEGVAADITLDGNGESVTLVYVDSTKGWVLVNESTTIYGAEYVVATGGNSTATCGDYKIHTFTSPGTFCVSNAGNPGGSNSVEYIVSAGGGGGGAYTPTEPGAGGGGGAGGFRFASPSLAPATYPAKPLAGSNVPVTVQGYPVTVGAGGAGQSGPGDFDSNPGSNSIFSTITSTGGGGTKNYGGPSDGSGKPGGSGGGAGGTGLTTKCAGSGNTPPVSPPQGNDGGTYVGTGGPLYATAGGGGATAVGESKPNHNNPTGGNGGAGAGVPNAFGTSGENCGSFYYFSGGGGGGIYGGGSAGSGGLGGGGDGLQGSGTGGAGTANTGGGGGGQGNSIGGSGGAGGSGIVIIRYKFQ